MTEFRTPSNDVLEEVRYRLETFKFPSFDRAIVEQLVARIEAAEGEIKYWQGTAKRWKARAEKAKKSAIIKI